MSNPRKANQNFDFPATISAPKPGDFPVGSAKSRAAARAIIEGYATEERKIEQAEYGNLTPFDAALSEDCSGYKKRIAVGVAQMAQERAKVFGISLPTPDELRHGRALAKEVDRITGGKGLSLSNSDPAEWERLRSIAKESVKAKGS